MGSFLSRNKMRAARLFCLVLALLTLPVFAFADDEDSTSWYNYRIENMTLREKVGQLFVIRPDQVNLSVAPGSTHSSLSKVKTFNKSMLNVLKDYPAGGFVFYDKNVQSPAQVTAFIKQMNEAVPIEPFIAIDEEGGRVTRLANAPSKGFKLPRYKSMESIGNTGDTSKAYDAGFEIGKYLVNYGFNLNFAPVADINTNPKNRVIGDRAFGSDPVLVSNMVNAFIDGMHQNPGILACTKHFPGHGDTVNDTHHGRVVVKKTWDEILEAEIIPFKESFDNADMIMLAHITLVNVTSDNLPASLSKELVTGKLREELGYDGVIITDSLAMYAISKLYDSKETAIVAFEAGSDLLMNPADYRKAFDGIVNAVETGRISEQRLEESLLRIMKLKEKMWVGAKGIEEVPE